MNSEENKYSLMLVDVSYLLTRNLWVSTKSKSINEFNAGDVLRLTIQTLNKTARDYGITCDKIIMIADAWNKEIGGYYRTDLIKNYIQYKGNRKFYTEEDLKNLKSDPNADPEDINKIEREIEVNKLKYKIKKIMQAEFPKIGIPYVSFEGYEFDDIATIASFKLYNQILSSNMKPMVIFTKDSDLSYSLSPVCVQFKLPSKGGEPEIVDYNQMIETVPEELRNKGLSLYNYYSILSALGIGHNFTKKVLKNKRANITEVITHIMNNDYSDIDDVDCFNAQLSSFFLDKLPKVDQVYKIVDSFMSIGSIGDATTFRNFCNTYRVNQITDDYYRQFTERLNPSLYQGA